MITIIAAMDRNGTIGKGSALPWPRLAPDMAWFRSQTLGKAIVMGRKTFETFGGKPLPKRTNIVLTTNPLWKADGAEVAASVQAILESDRPETEIMIIGGAQIYALFLPHAHRMLLTHIDAEYEGDTRFPSYDESKWKETGRTRPETLPSDCPNMDFIEYTRVK